MLKVLDFLDQHYHSDCDLVLTRDTYLFTHSPIFKYHVSGTTVSLDTRTGEFDMTLFFSDSGDVYLSGHDCAVLLSEEDTGLTRIPDAYEIEQAIEKYGDSLEYEEEPVNMKAIARDFGFTYFETETLSPPMKYRFNIGNNAE